MKKRVFLAAGVAILSTAMLLNLLPIPMSSLQILRLWIIQFLELLAPNKLQVMLLMVYLKMTNMGI